MVVAMDEIKIPTKVIILNIVVSYFGNLFQEMLNYILKSLNRSDTKLKKKMKNFLNHILK